MTDEHVVTELKSMSWSRTTSMLSRLSSDKEYFPSESTFELMIRFFSDEDADIRQQAIFAVGLHWHYLPAVPALLMTLERVDEETNASTCAARALGLIAHDHEIMRQEVVRGLARVALDANRLDEVRDQAYTSALWAAHRNNVKTYAKEAVVRDMSDSDRDWLISVASTPPA